jgi:WD40 repeat protein
VSINPVSNAALVVGNRGTVIAIDPNNIPTKIKSSTSENLRAVRWTEDGTMALITGNNGTLIKYTAHGSEGVDVGRANLRGISWRKNTPQALVTSNCFAEEFIPSPNLFLFDADENTLNPVSEGRSDLIGVDWNPDGSFALVVGYEVVWHNGFIGRYDESGLYPVDFENSHVYPTAVSWDPTGRVAAITTAAPEPHASQGRIMLWDGKILREIYRNEDFFFSNIAWSPAGFKLAAVASTEARTFDS